MQTLNSLSDVVTEHQRARCQPASCTTAGWAVMYDPLYGAGFVIAFIFLFICLKCLFFFRAEEGDAAFTEDADTRKLGRSHI